MTTQAQLCPKCSYELTGLVQETLSQTKCPECGYRGTPTNPEEIALEKERLRSIDRKLLMCMSIFLFGPVIILFVTGFFAVFF